MNDESAKAKTERYQEFEYRYVQPPVDLLADADGLLAGLTPLELTYIRWRLVTGTGYAAMEKLIHPAIPFDTTIHNDKVLSARQVVKDMLDKIQKTCPFLKMYTTEYMLGLLHEEIQHLRVAARHPRFKDNLTPQYTEGKKSLHEAEVADANLFLQCLTQVRELCRPTAPKDGDVTSPAGGTGGGTDRVFSETQKLLDILRESGTPPPTTQ